MQHAGGHAIQGQWALGLPLRARRVAAGRWHGWRPDCVVVDTAQCQWIAKRGVQVWCGSWG